MAGSTGKSAIVVSKNPSAWMSCRIITPNLQQAYDLALENQATSFSYTPRMERSEVWNLARRIHESRPDRIVFIDHVPHPGGLLFALESCYGTKPLPPLYFHLYGDFTLYTREWLAISRLLRKRPVRFISASHRQRDLVSQFVVNSRNADGVCPFPVSPRDFSYQPELRRKWRKRLGAREGEPVFLYTGRLSMQKNVCRLVSEVAHFRKSTGVPAKLVLAGGFDDLGAPFFGVRMRPGFYYQYWLKTVKELAPEHRDSVLYLGQLGSAELKGLYHAADAYVSLSLHHDEDFGMAPAEALSCGTSAVLTDWGGYASFAAPSGDRSVSFIPSIIGESGLSISSEDIVRALFRISASRESSEEKAKRSKDYLSRFSIEAASRIIRELHRKPAPAFEGFSWITEKHQECMAKPIPFAGGPRKNSFYEAIYGKYTAAYH